MDTSFLIQSNTGVDRRQKSAKHYQDMAEGDQRLDEQTKGQGSRLRNLDATATINESRARVSVATEGDNIQQERYATSSAGSRASVDSDTAYVSRATRGDKVASSGMKRQRDEIDLNEHKTTSPDRVRTSKANADVSESNGRVITATEGNRIADSNLRLRRTKVDTEEHETTSPDRLRRYKLDTEEHETTSPDRIRTSRANADTNESNSRVVTATEGNRIQDSNDRTRRGTVDADEHIQTSPDRIRRSAADTATSESNARVNTATEQDRIRTSGANADTTESNSRVVGATESNRINESNERLRRTRLDNTSAEVEATQKILEAFERGADAEGDAIAMDYGYDPAKFEPFKKDRQLRSFMKGAVERGKQLHGNNPKKFQEYIEKEVEGYKAGLRGVQDQGSTGYRASDPTYPVPEESIYRHGYGRGGVGSGRITDTQAAMAAFQREGYSEGDAYRLAKNPNLIKPTDIVRIADGRTRMEVEAGFITDPVEIAKIREKNRAEVEADLRSLAIQPGSRLGTVGAPDPNRPNPAANAPTPVPMPNTATPAPVTPPAAAPAPAPAPSQTGPALPGQPGAAAGGAAPAAPTLTPAQPVLDINQAIQRPAGSRVILQGREFVRIDSLEDIARLRLAPGTALILPDGRKKQVPPVR